MSQFAEDKVGNCATDVCKSVAVEEEERCPLVATAEEVQRLAERQDLLLLEPPVGCDCVMAL